MDSVFDCGICLVAYDELVHKPLSLPCGHVFCQDCLMKQGKDTVVCPFDKLKFDLQGFSLPCCYAILGNLPKFSQKDSCCIRHPKKKVKFLCKSHDKFLCTDCVIEHTGNGHNIIAFTVNTHVVKTELKELELICEVTIKENEDSWKDLENKHKAIKDFYHNQINKINYSYENALKVLALRKREQISLVSKHLADHCKLVDKHKDIIVKTLENSSKVFHQLKQLQNSLPHYETLCLTIKSLKQELKYLESPIDSLNVFFLGFKSDPFTVSFTSLEHIEDPAELENIEKKNKAKACTHKQVLQNSNTNDGNSLKATSQKCQEKLKQESENKSPERNLKARQNANSRNHPKRMPWKKRNRSL